MTSDTPTLPHGKSVWRARDGAFDADIRLAAMTRGGVMITGPIEGAEALAIEILRRSQPSPSQAHIVDGADESALDSALGHPGDARPLLLRNVDHLSMGSQARLLVRMAQGGQRIICWSQDPPDQKLVPELFYRLNVVRIDLRAND